MIGISVGMMFVGGILGLVGLMTPGTDGYNLQRCGWCGGSGRVSSGARCGLCDGAGGAAFENSVYAKGTWFGILIAAAGVVMYFVVKDMKNSVPNPSTPKATQKTTTAAAPKQASEKSPYHQEQAQQHTVYMAIDQVELHPDLPEYSCQVWGEVLRGNIYGQQVVLVKSRSTGETVKFKVAGDGLKGKAGDRARLRIYVTGGGRLKVAAGDSLYI